MNQDETYWVRKHIGEPERVVRLAGGINSHVYQITVDKKRYIVKRFAKGCPDKEQRIENEVRFLKYAKRSCPQYVGNLEGVCVETDSIVLREIAGEAFVQGEEVKERQYQDALKFLELLNRERIWAQEPNWMALGSETDVMSHLEDIGQRIERLDSNHLKQPYRARTNRYIQFARAEWERIESSASDQIRRGDLTKSISVSDMLLSPGDFGFHNAIKTTSGVVFIDFEFAGLEDPCKIACDFFMQPKVPIRRGWEEMLSILRIRDSSRLEARLKVMKQVVWLKWLCIILKYADEHYLERQCRDGIISNVEDFCEDRMNTAEKHYSILMQ